MALNTLATDRDAAIQLLRDVGLRVTSPRLEVLQLLTAEPHQDVESITAAARDRLGTLTSQAVYEMLRNFMETGLVRKFERPGRTAVFELAGAPHQHAVCHRCGRVANVEVEAPAAPKAALRGWRVDDTEVVYHGECPDCRKRGAE
ncbi:MULTISPECIES: Fur family transcriptional regulator [Kitasatospora]|uniref:Fur family transcriptional regulator n=1 Tax=Kitasatospora TaxID=2063 RepID=UPI000CB7622F|nr:Fur family transcriptional regulator [Kitasatospora sp. GP30]MDH6142452.1 Fe2+ or Zn2+ uptake regulation protein [Kitasatospora sp. GP30]